MHDDVVDVHQKRGNIILMNKQEFIDRLRVSLNGRISAIEVEDTIQYYKDYIDSEVRKGKSEAEVLAMLGDPRLIARTIIETSPSAEDANDARSAGGTNYGNNSYQSSGTYHDDYQEEPQKKPKIFRMPGWLLVILVILVLYLILSVVFSVLAFLAPVIIVVVAVVFMIKLFRDWLN